MGRTAENQKISIILVLSIAIIAVVLVTGTLVILVINIVSSAAYGINVQTKTNLVASTGSPHVVTHSPFRHFTNGVTHSHFRPFTNTTAATHSPFRHFRTFTAGNATATSNSAGTPATPIKHIIVIFQENNSFDHYFGTYPNATNPRGESQFIPTTTTPHVNNLEWPKNLLGPNNPNSAQPQRLDPHKAKQICSPLHEYTPEQKSYNGGKMDKFVENDNDERCTKTLYR